MKNFVSVSSTKIFSVCLDFNDLYYQEVGNSKLKPENARQYNIGLTYSRNVCTFLPYLSATVDAYYNKVTDKIIAYPTKNLAVWSMRNLGSVEIKGIDATGSLSLQPGKVSVSIFPGTILINGH